MREIDRIRNKVDDFSRKEVQVILDEIDNVRGYAERMDALAEGRLVRITEYEQWHRTLAAALEHFDILQVQGGNPTRGAAIVRCPTPYAMTAEQHSALWRARHYGDG